MKQNYQSVCVFLAVLLVTAASTSTMAEEESASQLGTSEEVMARDGDVVLTQGEMDAAFNRIPEAYRLRFIRDGERVDQLIGRLMRTKRLAHVSKEAGFDKEAIVQTRISLAADEELAEAWMDKVMAEAPEADFELLAREYYQANPAEFMSQPTIDVSHILISSEERSREQALELLVSLREQIIEDPSRFQQLVMEYSEDPSKTGNKGRFPNMKRGQMVESFERAAFALKDPGELSQPVETTYGYHLIILNGMTEPQPLPFEQVRDQLMEMRRQTYLQDYQKRYVAEKTSAPIEIPEGAIESLVKRYFGEDFREALSLPEE